MPNRIVRGEGRHEREMTGSLIFKRGQNWCSLVVTCNCGLVMVITGFYCTSLNYSLLCSPVFLSCLSSLLCSCTISLLSTCLSFHIRHILITLLYAISSTYSLCLMLSPFLSDFASAGSLWSLCSDGRGLNPTLEMIIPLCSCSGVFCIFIILTNTLLAIFSLCLIWTTICQRYVITTRD